jgi:hypothetical protein
MGCSCKSNSGVKKQATQIRTRTTQTTRVSQNNNSERKQIVIRRPVR